MVVVVVVEVVVVVVVVVVSTVKVPLSTYTVLLFASVAKHRRE